MHKVKKPLGTFYSDYVIQNGKCYAIFEHECRETTKFVCKTNKTNDDWRSFKITETETHLIINLGK